MQTSYKALAEISMSENEMAASIQPSTSKVANTSPLAPVSEYVEDVVEDEDDEDKTTLTPVKPGILAADKILPISGLESLLISPSKYRNSDVVITTANLKLTQTPKPSDAGKNGVGKAKTSEKPADSKVAMGDTSAAPKVLCKGTCDKVSLPSEDRSGQLIEKINSICDGDLKVSDADQERTIRRLHNSNTVKQEVGSGENVVGRMTDEKVDILI